VLWALLANVDRAALAFVVLAPFEGYAKALSGSAVKLLGAVLFISWLVTALRRRAVRLAEPVVRCAIALLGMLLVATVVHPNGPLGQQVAIRYLSYIAACVVLTDCMAYGLDPRRVARFFVGASTVAAVAGLVAFFRHTLRAGGPVGDPNDFAFFLLVALVLTVGLWTDEHRRRHVVAAVILLVAMLATFSRGALLGLAAVLIVGVATHRVRLRVLVGTAMVAGATFVGVLLLDPAKFTTSFHAKGVVAQQNVDERVVRWRAAAEMTYDNPLVGLGPAGFRENFDRYIDYAPVNVTHQLDVAHEMYLEVSSELGLPGLGAFLGLIVFGAVAAVTAGRNPEGAGLPDAVWLATVGAAVAAIFLTEQYYLPLWLLAALGTALRRQGERRS
jgi:O-antigen ligase